MNSNLLTHTRVVLAHPFFPENVGAIARAMRVTGLTQLRLAGGVDPLHANARKMAVGAASILEEARRFETLDEALEGASYVVGTTPDLYEGWPTHDPAEAARFAASWALEGQVAMVFGNEKNGLSRHALERCHAVLRIPQVGGGPSLNLAQAAMIIFYEWMQVSQELRCETTLAQLAPPAQLAGLETQLFSLLTDQGFMKPHHASKKKGALRRILGRVRLTPEEVALLRGVLATLERLQR